MSIRRRDDYVRPFRVLRCKINDQVDFQAPDALRSTTEATVLIEMFGDEELVAANGHGPVHAIDNAMRKILEVHYPQLAEVRLEEFDVRLLHGIARMKTSVVLKLWSESWRFFLMAAKDGAPLGLPRISFKPVLSA